jgi:hypothetical protein
MTLTKFIYDDRNGAANGWFLRQYFDGEEINERDLDSLYNADDATINDLIRAAKLDPSLTDNWELYRSINDSQPSETK